MSVAASVDATVPNSIIVIADVDLSAGGALCLDAADGWSSPEPEFTWVDGKVGRLTLSLDVAQIPKSRTLFLALSVVPLIHHPLIPLQRLRIFANGRRIGAGVVREIGLFGCHLETALVLASDGVLSLEFEHLDASRPTDLGIGQDSRALGIAYKRLRVLSIPDEEFVGARPPDRFQALREPEDPPLLADYGAPPFIDDRLKTQIEASTGLGLPGLAERFESLGDNCEFGIFQRFCGAEPLGLFRFARTPADSLVANIAAGFPSSGQVEAIRPFLEGQGRREYMIREDRLGIIYHTYQFEDEISFDEIRARHTRSVAFLMRKFTDDLREGSKIFVRKSNAPSALADILPLYYEVRQHGPNRLLWVTEADDWHPVGSVDILVPGLMRGYVRKFANMATVTQLCCDSWALLCANAILAQPSSTHPPPAPVSA